MNLLRTTDALMIEFTVSSFAEYWSLKYLELGI
jgi:hypothetical protein